MAAYSSFTITQPFLGAPLQFVPALGSRELEDLVDAYVLGPASKQDKLSEVTIDFYNRATVDLNTGALTRTYTVRPAAQWTTHAFEQSPTRSQSSGFSPPLFTPSPGSSVTLGDSAYGSISMTPPNRHHNRGSRVAKKPTKKEAKKAAEARLPGFSIMTKDGIDVTNSAGRGTKTKEQREHAHLMRIMKACDDCKKKKVRCDPSHRRSHNAMTRTSTSKSSSSSGGSSSSPTVSVPSLSRNTSSASQAHIAPSFAISNAIDDFVLFPEDSACWNPADLILPEFEQDLDLSNFDFDSDLRIVSDDFAQMGASHSFNYSSFDSYPQLSNVQFDGQLGFPSYAPVDLQPENESRIAMERELDFSVNIPGDGNMVSHEEPQGYIPGLQARPNVFTSTEGWGAQEASRQCTWSHIEASISPTSSDRLHTEEYWPGGLKDDPQLAVSDSQFQRSAADSGSEHPSPGMLSASSGARTSASPVPDVPSATDGSRAEGYTDVSQNLSPASSEGSGFFPGDQLFSPVSQSRFSTTRSDVLREVSTGSSSLDSSGVIVAPRHSMASATSDARSSHVSSPMEWTVLDAAANATISPTVDACGPPGSMSSDSFVDCGITNAGGIASIPSAAQSPSPALASRPPVHSIMLDMGVHENIARPGEQWFSPGSSLMSPSLERTILDTAVNANNAPTSQSEALLGFPAILSHIDRTAYGASDNALNSGMTVTATSARSTMSNVDGNTRSLVERSPFQSAIIYSPVETSMTCTIDNVNVNANVLQPAGDAEEHHAVASGRPSLSSYSHSISALACITLLAWVFHEQAFQSISDLRATGTRITTDPSTLSIFTLCLSAVMMAKVPQIFNLLANWFDQSVLALTLATSVLGFLAGQHIVAGKISNGRSGVGKRFESMLEEGSSSSSSSMLGLIESFTFGAIPA